VKRLLMIAFHFPPLSISSGVHRTLSFARHLREAGWEPIVLTAALRAYEDVSETPMSVLPKDLIVERAFALDTARHLAVFGRYPAALARPDRWASWWFGAVPVGIRLLRRYRPAAIWSTYPIATAHAIGATLSRLSSLPWIADFRDPMAQDGYPSDPKTWASFKRIEEHALRSSAYAVFVAPGAKRMYAERYPDVPADRFRVIENGYDEEAFREAEAKEMPRRPLNEGAITLLHSGIVYPRERDPRGLFEALRRLDRRGAISPGSLRVRFRGARHDSVLLDLAKASGVSEYLQFLPPTPYTEALVEMLRADGLVVMQASNCNDQIPAKLYEYARAGRPILGLTDPKGDTARALRGLGIEDIAPLDSADAIEQVLPPFVEAVRSGAARLPDQSAVRKTSRRGRAEQLLELLNLGSANGQFTSAPAATSNSSALRRVKLPHPWQRDEGTLVGRLALPLDPEIAKVRLLYGTPVMPARGRALQLTVDGEPISLSGTWTGPFVTAELSGAARPRERAGGASASPRAAAWSCIADYARELPFPDGAFDIVVLHRTLDRLAAVARRDGRSFVPAEFLSRVGRILADGGVVIGCAGNRYGVHGILRRTGRWLGGGAEGASGGDAAYPMSVLSCRRALADGGFGEIRVFTMLPSLDSPNRLMSIERGWSRRAGRRHAEALRPLVSPSGYLMWRVLAEIGLSQYLGAAIFFWGRKGC